MHYYNKILKTTIKTTKTTIEKIKKHFLFSNSLRDITYSEKKYIFLGFVNSNYEHKQTYIFIQVPSLQFYNCCLYIYTENIYTLRYLDVWLNF